MEVLEIDQLARRIAALKEAKGEKEDELKEINKDLDSAELRFSEILLEQNKTKWDVSGLGSFDIRISTNWSVGERNTLINYFKESNPGMLTVNAMTLKAWANAERENNPDWDYRQIGLNDPFEKKKITFKRSK